MLKSRPLYYEMESEAQEVYQTETYYFLQVVDFSGKLEQHLKKQDWYVSMDDFLEMLFNAQKDYKLSDALKKYIDLKKFNVVVLLIREGTRDHKAVVKITKRTLREKLSKRFFKES